MTQKPLKPSASSTPIKKFQFTGSHVATAAMFLIVVFMWRDLTQTKKAMAELHVQNLKLGSSLSQTESKLQTANRELARFKTGISQTMGKADKKSVTIKKAAEAPETLFLQEPSVSQTAAGLVARFDFKPDDTSQLPDRITLVVRVPSSSEAKILSLAPAAAAADSRLECVVNAKGNLGMIEGSPADLKALVFEVTVSQPVTATVRGSKGIKPFEMDITPDGCTVRKL